jgi:hypothetical protein
MIRTFYSDSMALPEPARKGRLAAACAAVIACVLISGSVQAQSDGSLLTEPSQEQTQIQEQTQASDPAVDAGGEQALQREADRRAMLEQIENTVGSFGPYDSSLIEMHEDLGRLYMADNRFADAASAYADALQLVRVADGLYSER